eukprot:gene31414-38797_t
MSLCVQDIFAHIDAHPELSFALKVSYLEIYNDEVNDLLGDGSKKHKNLTVGHNDPVKGIQIKGLIVENVTTPDQFQDIVDRGEANRSFNSTKMNAESSRSHVVYRITIETTPRTASSKPRAPVISFLSLVDLAGSERQKSTKSSGEVLTEANSINGSLSVLGKVINALSKAQSKKSDSKAYVPFRDCQLTRILQQSLEGNTVTSIILAMSPAKANRDETSGTLRFGLTCKTVKTTVFKNKAPGESAAEVQSRERVLDLEAQIAELKQSLVEKHNTSASDSTATTSADEAQNKVDFSLLSQEVLALRTKNTRLE